MIRSPAIHRGFLLFAAIAWLALLGHAPFLAIHVVSEHDSGHPAAPASTEGPAAGLHDSHDHEDHGHRIPPPHSGRRPSAPSSPATLTAAVCGCGPVSAIPADRGPALVHDVASSFRNPHLSRSPVLRF